MVWHDHSHFALIFLPELWLKNGRPEKDEMVLSYRQRRNLFTKDLNEMGLSCHQPEDAFYAFSTVQNTGLSSEDFAERLLEEVGVAVVPGNAFGASGKGFIRCSYATSVGHINEALERMGKFVKHLGENKQA